MYREIGGSRSWGSAVAVFNKELSIEEVGAVRTKYGSARFQMLGTYPGAVIVARVDIPAVGPITCVSVYGLINVYAQTTMLRIVADLIPLFDSPEGERVVLGGDLNVTTAASPSTELRRYEAILKAVGVARTAKPGRDSGRAASQLENCACGASSCHHLRTYGGGQLDWLFATPELAQRCRRLRVEYGQCASLSDHAPIIANLEFHSAFPPDIGILRASCRRWAFGTERPRLERVEGEGCPVSLSLLDSKFSCEARAAKSGGDSQNRNGFQQNANNGHGGGPLALASSRLRGNL